MKKLLIMGIALAALGLVGCGQQAEGDLKPENQVDKVSTPKTEEGVKDSTAKVPGDSEPKADDSTTKPGDPVKPGEKPADDGVKPDEKAKSEGVPKPGEPVNKVEPGATVPEKKVDPSSKPAGT
ncbi:MAG: hypothetical protein ABL949_08245 [Fimbriimonadaceae bacterium]